jgi:excinuclease ABC subunit C
MTDKNDFSIEEELKKLPAKPGVYIMHDASDEIIYVGKAVSLKNRVRSYFRKVVNRGPKIDRMISKIDHFEYIVTDSELEALVLESNLIKEYRPKYNTMLMDDKSYPYIKVTLGEKYPRVLLARGMKKDSSKYYGPYSNAGAVHDTIDLTQKVFGIRPCSKKIDGDEKIRPCLYYHIGQCPAPCDGKISEEEYRANAERAVAFLNGNDRQVTDELTAKMNAASEAMRFEEAAGYRDLLESIRQIGERQKITGTDGDDRDVIAIAMEDRDAVVQVYFVRGGKLIGREHFYLTADDTDDPKSVLRSFISQYYAGTPFIPKEMMLKEDIEDRALLEEWLSGKKGSRVTIRIPQKGMKEKLTEMAEENARLVLSRDRERMKREDSRTLGAVREISSLLGIPSAGRIEAFDISNISGFESVGSMIVYEKGKPKRTDYRKFRIKSVRGADDYASMEEVLTRRFKRAKEESQGFEKMPDLILMDGGKGQVNVALRVLGEMELRIPVAGMVKDDFHRTRGLYFHDTEMPIDRSSEGFKLITRIQDEAHRFAIEYHRLLRSKEQVHSVLDDIEGIGPARRRALMKSFESIEKLRGASVEELAGTPSMNEKAARTVWSFFHESR